MVYEEHFWEDDYWSRFGKEVWRLFKVSSELIGVLGKDEATDYVNTAAMLSKYIVEKLSEHVEIEEPEPPGVRDALLVTEFMKTIADFAIGKNPVTTLAWIMRNITYEYIRVNFESIYEKPERFDYLVNILGLEQIYEPPELLTGREIDLSFYHAPGYLDNTDILPGVEHAGGGRFRYVLKIRDRPDYEKMSIGALIVKLGLLSWEILRRKPGILSIFETTDARTLYLELAATKIPPQATEIIESKGIHVLGDGRIYYFKDEKFEPDGGITITLISDQYNVGVPIPKACRDSIYELRGPLVYIYEICLETDLLLRENKYSLSKEPSKKLNVVEYLRGIQPYIYLGVWDLVFKDNKFIVVSRT